MNAQGLSMERKVLRQRSVDEKAEKAKRRKQLSTKLNKLIKVKTVLHFEEPSSLFILE